MWAVPCYAVRCHEHKITSIKMSVCIVRDGVSMVLPLGSQKENVFTPMGLLRLNCELSTPLCDEHVP